MKTWLITGASRGFGLDITKAVLATGDQVIATVRSKPDELAQQFNDDARLLVVTMDVTNESQVQDGVKKGVDHFGRIDILVNNAGYGMLSAVEEATSAEVKANYEVNVFGTLNMIRAVLPFMRKERKGHVINISSVGGLSGAYPGWGLYASSKFAIEGLSEGLALEAAPLGIKVTVVAPGFFRTNFLDKSSMVSSQQVIADYKDTAGAMREMAPQISYRQPGDPKKLAEAFVKLGNTEHPPVHLLLGNDTLAKYREKTAALEREIEEWYDVVTGTDHEDVGEK